MQVYKNVPLSTILWYEIGGVAETVIDISSTQDLHEALQYIQDHNITNVFSIGFGSNILFPDTIFNGVILRFQIQEDGEGVRRISEDTVEAFAGEMFDSVIQFGFDNSLIGLEWAGGLPGTVGAAVRGNVGAFGGEVQDVFFKAHCIKILDHGGYEELILTRDEMEFAYRTSKVKKEKLIVVSSQFKLKIATPEELLNAREAYYQNIIYRQERHPLDYPNCGSVFKNISNTVEVEKVKKTWPNTKELIETKWHGKVSMGYLIERLGLKGFQVGKAQVSEKHQNFIVNLGGAKSQDVRKIITTIENAVQKEFGFTPEVEIEIIE